MSFFEDNVDILCKAYPNFKTNILGKHSTKCDLIFSQSKSGLPTAKVGGKFIHSNHEPVREAERLVESEIPIKSSSCIVEGFGLGYYVEAILRLRPNMSVIIVEPSAERFLKALESRNFHKIFSSPLVSLIIGYESENIRILLPGLSGDIHIFKHRALYDLNKEYFREIDLLVQRFVSRKAVNTATLNRFGELWVRNLIRNLNYLPKAGDVGNLTKIFKDIPVLLLAAGPSLDTIIPHLDKLRKRFILVAVDTSAAILMDAGYDPDFTVIVDPQYWNTRHLDRVDLSKTILISESSTYPGIFRKNHKRIFYCGSLFPLGVFMERFSGHKKRLGAGGSVATTAWDFCRLISTGALYSGGLDLGFPENRTHFHGSFFEEKVHIETSRTAPSEDFAFNYISSGNTYWAENNLGFKTLTDQRLSIYIHWFEEQISINKIKNIWNISPLGIRIEGMPYKDLEKLIEYPLVRDKIDKICNSIKENTNKEIEITRKSLMAGLYVLRDELERLFNLSNNAILRITEYKNGKMDNFSIPNLVKKLDRIDQEIMGSESSEISSFLLQPIIKEITENDRAESFDAGLDESEKLYSRIKESANFHKSLILSYLNNSLSNSLDLT